MKAVFNKISLMGILLLSSEVVFGQSGESTGNVFLISMAIVISLLLLFAFLFVSDGLLNVEAKNAGIAADISVWPTAEELKTRKVPKGASEDKYITLKRGYDILLKGKVKEVIVGKRPNTVAIQPLNFVGLAPIPKMMVEVGDRVLAGDPVLFDKRFPEIKYCAPVSGEVIAVNRGEKRAIQEVVILADSEIEYKVHQAPVLESATREQLVDFLMEAGFWSFIRQRPFNIIPDLKEVPRDIFISSFDTAPLAADLSFIAKEQVDFLQAGIDTLRKLTSGKVYLGLDGKNVSPSNPFTRLKNVEKTWFKGAHPAGNVGVHIHHIAPIGTTNTVWTVGVQELILLGKLMRNGVYDTSRLIALVGSEVNEPKYIRTYLGANIGDLVRGELKSDHVRIISGNILTGEKKSSENYLNAFDTTVSVIKEGDYYEMFGWLLPLKARPSMSGTFPTSFIPGMTFEGDTNTHGEKRAFVMTGQYERVLPMNIYVLPLMKSIVAENYEKMEGLGILELVEEDVALCEFTCTSKQPLQKILRGGLTFMQSQA